MLMTAVTGASANPIGTADFLALPKADVILLGEIHDNPQHHANRAGIRGTAFIGHALRRCQLIHDRRAGSDDHRLAREHHANFAPHAIKSGAAGQAVRVGN